MHNIRSQCGILQMGDPTVEVTEENRDASQEAKAQAMEAISEGILIYFYS